MRTRSLILHAILFFTIGSVLSQAQSIDDSGGRRPYGSYFDAAIDSINLYNGNLMLDIRLFSLPGRELSTGLHVTYNSQKWQWADLLGWPVGLYSGGWRVADQMGQAPIYTVQWAGCEPIGFQSYYDWYNVIANWIDGLGTKHVYTGQVTEFTNECGNSNVPSGNNLILTAAEGNGSQLETGNSPSEAVLTFKDGTRIAFGSNPTISTRNGNYLSRGANGLPLNDTLNRTILFDSNSGTTHFRQYSIKDSNGVPQVYTLNFTDGFSVWNPLFGQSETRNDRLDEIVLPDGSKYVFEYGHIQGFLTKVTLPSGGFIAYEYPSDDPANVTNDYVIARRVSFDGVSPQSSWTYSRTSNSPVRDVTMTRPNGDQEVHRFNAQGLEYETQWHQAGVGLRKRVRITRNTDGSPWVVKTSLDDASEQTTTTLYDGIGNVTLRDETDWHNYNATSVPPLRRTQVFYNYYYDPFPFQRPMREIVSYRNPSNGAFEEQKKTEFEYDEFALFPTPGDVPNKGSVSGVRGNLTTQRHYDGLGGSVTDRFHYDDLGNVVIHSDWLGQDTSFSYADRFSDEIPRNTFAYVTHESNAVQHNEFTTYDYNTGLVKKTTDVRGQNTLYAYDRFGRTTQIQEPGPTSGGGPLITDYAYFNDERRMTVNVTGPSADVHRSEIFFDRFYRQFREVDFEPDGSVTIDRQYDANGRLFRESAPYRNGETPAWTETHYDGLDRVSGQINPDGTFVQWGFWGRWSSFTDEAGVERWFTSNGIGQMARVDETGDSSVPTNYTHYVTGPLRSVDQSGQTRSFTYDQLGQLRSETHPESGTASYQYNGGQLTSRTDARGIVTNYAYDAIGRILSISYSDGTPPISYSYDQNGDIGSLTSSSDGTGTTAYDYDPAGNVVSETRHFFGVDAQLTTSYTYYRNAKLHSVTYPSGRTVTYAYQSGGGFASDELASVHHNFSGAALLGSLQYNAAGQITSRTLGNSVVASQSYNVRQQVTAISAERNGTTLMNLTYGYGDTNNNGRIQSRTDVLSPDHSVNYEYDWFHRLKSISAMNATWGITWDFDAWGNRTSQVPTGQATSKVGSPSFGYINNRNSSYGYDAAGNVTYDGTKYYDYDAENRLWRVDGGAFRYQYDADGRRVKKISASETTYYVYGQVGLLSEFAVGTATAQAAATNRLVYRVGEQTGTAVLLLAADGSLIEQNRVLPYGEPWQATGNDNEQKFSTYQRDSETGNDYAMARFYAGKAGRFMSPDPGNAGAKPEDPQTWNAYTLAANDPINFADPSGANRVRIQDPGDCWTSLGGSVEEESVGLEFWEEVIRTTIGGHTTETSSLHWAEVFDVYCNYSLLEGAHTILDVAGFVPGLGEIADAANFVLYVAEGDKVNAAISAAAMVPVVGSAATVGRRAAKAFRSATQKKAFLKQLATDPKTASWMKQWLKEGRNPPGFVVDHIKPLSIGGLDIPKNMRLVTGADHIVHHRYYRPWQK